MNHIFRVIWNKRLGVYQVASELSRGHGSTASRSTSKRINLTPKLKVVALAIALIGPATSAFADTGISILSTYLTPGTATSGTGWTWDGSNITILEGAALPGDPNSQIVGVEYNAIGTITNSGTLGAYISLYNAGGTVSEINNTVDGVINAVSEGIINQGTLTTLNNDGLIGGTSRTTPSSGAGVENDGVLTTVRNGATGVIEGQNWGIANEGGFSFGSPNAVPVSIGTLTNNGLIHGGTTGVRNEYGSIGTLINTGTISGGTYALTNIFGTLGTVQNSGVMAGAIQNLSDGGSNDLTFTGGTGTIFGTLTGSDFTSVGDISNTYGNVTFASGNMLLNDNVSLASSGTLINTAATLQLNTSIAVTGSYSQGQAATLLIGVAGGAQATGDVSTDTGYGRLVVSGNTTIASDSSISLKSTTGGYAFAAGQRFVVVDTAGTASYNEGTLHYSILGYTSTVTGAAVTTSNNHTALVLTVASATAVTDTSSGSGSGTSTDTGTTATTTTTTTTSTSTSGSAGTGTSAPAAPVVISPVASPTTAIAKQSFGGLMSYTGVSNAGLLNLYDASIALATYGTSSDLNHAGAQLAPISQGATARAAAAPTYDVLGVVSAHLNGLRIADNSGNGDSSSSGGGSGVSTGERAAVNGLWGQVFGGHASENARDQVDGYSANFGGLMFGMDRAITDRLRVGGVFSYSNAAINNTGDTAGNSTRVNSYGLMAYGGYTANPWYANVSGGAVLQRYNGIRQVAFSGFSGNASSSFGGVQYIIKGEVGLPLAVGPVTVTPVAALTYSYLHQNGYAENGGNGAALSVGSAHATSVNSDIGVKIAHAFVTRSGNIVPEFAIAWRHEYDNTRTSTSASYAADPSSDTAFTSLGASPVTNLADIAFGVTLLRADNLSLTARYALLVGNGYTSQSGTLKVRQLF